MTGAKQATVLLSDEQAENLERRILNWVEWLHASDSSARRAGCGSAERWYRAPRADGEAFAAAVHRSMVDHVDGELVDRAISSMPNNAHRVYLQMAYARSRSARQIAARLRVPMSRFEELHRLVLRELARRIVELEHPVQLIRRGRNWMARA